MNHREIVLAKKIRSFILEKQGFYNPIYIAIDENQKTNSDESENITNPGFAILAKRKLSIAENFFYDCIMTNIQILYVHYGD